MKVTVFGTCYIRLLGVILAVSWGMKPNTNTEEARWFYGIRDDLNL